MMQTAVLVLNFKQFVTCSFENEISMFPVISADAIHQTVSN